MPDFKADRDPTWRFMVLSNPTITALVLSQSLSTLNLQVSPSLIKTPST